MCLVDIFRKTRHKQVNYHYDYYRFASMKSLNKSLALYHFRSFPSSIATPAQYYTYIYIIIIIIYIYFE